MRHLLNALLFLLLGISPAHAMPLDGELAKAFEAACATHSRPVAALGVVVADASSGAILFSRQADAPMMPASVLKLTTTAAALRVLGHDYRFETKVCASGSLDAGLFSGDLVLVGGGDPGLEEAGLTALAQELQAKGISRVAGDLFVDASLFATPSWEPGWTVDDLNESYAPPIVALRVQPGSGSVDPGSSPGQRFKHALTAAGIALGGEIRSGRVASGAPILARHVSAPMSELVWKMNKASLNPIAEALFRTIGSRQALDPGTAKAGAVGVLEQLEGIGIASGDLRIADGSGLSRYNLITPRAIAQLLVAMNQAPEAALFRQSLPVAGLDGTLAKRFGQSRVKGRFFAKTGTMSSVSSLAGYLDGQRRYAIVILANGFTAPMASIRKLADDLVERFSDVLDRQPSP